MANSTALRVGEAEWTSVPGSVSMVARLCLASIFCGLAAGQAAALQSTLRGTIRSAHDSVPLGGVEVSISQAARSVYTSSSGAFSFSGLPDTMVTVGFRRVGFEARTLDIDLAGIDTLEIEVVLVPKAQALEPVTVVADSVRLWARLSDRERRRLATQGEFVDSIELRTKRDARLSDVLRRLRRARVMVLRTGGYGVYGRRDGGRASCPLGVWLDGIFIGERDPATRDAYNVDQWRADRLEHVEVYAGPSVTPMEFRAPGSYCGVLVLWTRRQ